MPLRAMFAALALLPAALAGCAGAPADGSPARAVPASALAYVEVAAEGELADLARRVAGPEVVRSVQPWLGRRAALALTGPRDGAAVVEVTDEQAALRAVRARALGRGRSAEAREGLLVVGTRRAVRAVLAARDGDASRTLAQSDRFARALEDAGGDGELGRGFVDVAALLRAASRGEGRAAMAAAALGTLGLETVGLALDGDRDALRLRGALRSDGGLPRGDGDAAAALAAAPSDGVAAIGVEAVLEELRRRSGLDLRRDLLAWMGDATLFVRPGMAAALVVRSTDPAASRAALPRLRRALAGSGLPLALRQQGDRVVLGFGERSVRAALAGGPALGAAPRFRAAAGMLPDGTAPSLWIDPAAVLALLGAAGDERFAAIGELGPFVAGARSDGDLDRFDAVLDLTR